MSAQLLKIQAHAEHLLDGFIGLRERYVMLSPMLFNRDVIDSYGKGSKARGFRIIKNNLFLFCCQDIAKLCLDAYDTSPSIKTIVERLASQPALAKELEDQYAVWFIEPPATEKDSAVLSALAKMKAREEQERRVKFQELLSELNSHWSSLSTSSTLSAFKTIRNKAAAHIDVHLVAGKYQLIDIGTLGIKWKDLSETITSMQRIVELVGLIVRSASFSWDSLDHQLEKASVGYWST